MISSSIGAGGVGVSHANTKESSAGQGSQGSGPESMLSDRRTNHQQSPFQKCVSPLRPERAPGSKDLVPRRPLPEGGFRTSSGVCPEPGPVGHNLPPRPGEGDGPSTRGPGFQGRDGSQEKAQGQKGRVPGLLVLLLVEKDHLQLLRPQLQGPGWQNDPWSENAEDSGPQPRRDQDLLGAHLPVFQPLAARPQAERRSREPPVESGWKRGSRGEPGVRPGRGRGPTGPRY